MGTKYSRPISAANQLEVSVHGPPDWDARGAEAAFGRRYAAFQIFGGRRAGPPFQRSGDAASPMHLTPNFFNIRYCPSAYRAYFY